MIAALHVLAATIGWYGYARIESQQRLLRSELLPLSSASQRVAGAIARLSLLSDSIESQRTDGKLERVQLLMDSLLETVDADLQLQRDSAARFASLWTQFEALKASLASGLQKQRRVISQAQAYSKAQAHALDLTEAMQLALEVLDPELLGPRLSRADIQDAQQAVAAWQVDLLSVPRLEDVAALEAVRLNMTQSLRSTVRVLSQGQALLAQSGLSDLLFELLNVATQADGLFGLRAELLGSELAVRADLIKVRSHSVQLAGLLDDLVARRNDDAGQASLDLQAVLNNSERALYAVSFLALVLSVLFSRLLVFRQVVRPLAGLTRRTAALAEGDLDAPVPRQRFEELAEIAASLRVFQDKLRQLANTEERLRQQNARLNQANEELDRFAYAASHDLRSPLRGARTLAGFIREDFGDALPDVIDGHMQRLDERLVKMEVLLADLLAYSRAGSEAETPELVAFRALVQEALDLVSDHEPIELTFELAEESAWLPPISIKQAIRNLLDNAVKYGSIGNAPLVLVFRSYLQGNVLVLELEDNGPGIPEAYRVRVLELFQSMQSNVRATSSGIGLAMVQRLLGRYDGSLTLLEPHGGSGTLARISMPLLNAESQDVVTLVSASA